MLFGNLDKPEEVLVIHRQHQINIEGGAHKPVQLNRQAANQNVLNLVVGKRLQQVNDFHDRPSTGNAPKNVKKPGTAPGLLCSGAPWLGRRLPHQRHSFRS
jgi:hypothetical protein